MNRRSFLKFCGIAPVVPGLAVEVLDANRPELRLMGQLNSNGIISIYYIDTGELIRIEHIYASN